MEATLTSKGQITIPKAIRQQLNLNKGDRLEFLLDKQKIIRIMPKTTSIKKLKGCVAKRKRPVSLKRMQKTIEAGWAGL